MNQPGETAPQSRIHPTDPTRSAENSRTVLGLDYGAVRIGVAVAVERLGIATPLKTIRGDCPGPDWPAIAALIEEWRPALLVVGRPAAADGSDGSLTKAAERFGRRLHGRFGCLVEMIDERYTSVAAHEILKEARRSGQRRRQVRRGDVDPVAAQVLLQAWLDGARATPRR